LVQVKTQTQNLLPRRKPSLNKPLTSISILLPLMKIETIGAAF
jgi:hypothetical protein